MDSAWIITIRNGKMGTQSFNVINKLIFTMQLTNEYVLHGKAGICKVKGTEKDPQRVPIKK